ncbi:hypothetical protein HG535_0H02800 [Zygotorulaspora mrakii]|uniref:Elongator complex protein 4 n=1 Tax=Zygotorulaspora mrakii TaxID=42260 RepID=A0A7H9B8V2_ZYGMR|nr:uncharacterized protein HG535_0H02800 [Zygotorulaspora mrakii]QLG74953.1 hypothetical protein HG535_0H02800 [Zygotorulaspora mrakii]
MSFRRRGEVLNGREGSPRTIPGRVPTGAPRNARNGSLQSSKNEITHDVGHSQENRVNPMRRGLLSSPINSMAALNIGNNPRTPNIRNIETLDMNHPGIRPSPASSQQTTSTGSFDLDRVLGHMGLPLGNSMIIKEQGTTEFSAVLCKLFAAQGIMHTRVENLSSRSDNTHLCVISANQGFSKELPGVYKGSSKDIKKTRIAEEQSKVTVQNLSEQAAPTRYNDLKIAWRYKLGDENSSQQPKDNESSMMETEYKDYNHQFNITSRMVPAPTPSEISYVTPHQPTQGILSQLEQIIKKHDNKLIRLIIPSLLHPATYPPTSFRLSGIIPLLHGIRSLVKKYENRCVLLATMSSDLVDDFLLCEVESMFDAVIDLEPFSQEMLQFLEKAYKSQPNKVQHGLLHISKLPIFSERGEMHEMRSHYAFKNGRKKFAIEEWDIPVADVDDSDKENSSALPHGHEHANKGMCESTESRSSTNISIDF